MGELVISLLGRPRILLDNADISLPFKQAEALLYYLLVEGEVTRNTVADLIWGGIPDERKVKSNMRNALYVLRKTFTPNFIIEPRKNVLQVDPSLNIRLDVALLRDPTQQDLDIYRGDFLQDFYLRENEYYNDWIASTRQELKLIYMERLKSSAALNFQQQHWSLCEKNAQRLITLDEFDEAGYYYLIQTYRARGEHHKALSLYDRLKKLLAEELYQFPSERVSQLTEQIRQERSHNLLGANDRQLTYLTQQHIVAPASCLYGRAAEQSELKENVFRFIHGGLALSQAIVGEAGIGKSALLEHFYQYMDSRDDVLLFHTTCYHAEESFLLKPWQSVFEQILHILDGQPQSKDDVYFRTMAGAFFPHLAVEGVETLVQDQINMYSENQRTMAHVLLRFAKDRKVILCFDDIQWADSLSLSLLQDIMTTDHNQNILFLLTCRNTQHEYTARFLEDMHLAHFLQVLPLERFNLEETAGLANFLLPNCFNTQELRLQLYHETEGNPFFIIETVNNMKYNGDLADITQNMRDTIRQRTMLLPSEDRSILDLLSFFFDGCSFSLLAELSQKADYELLDTLERLMSKQLIREINRGTTVYFHFTHQKILEFVYDELSMTKKRVLHGRIADCLEHKLAGGSQDYPIYHKLMYHFDRAGNQKKYLQYYIEYVYSQLNRLHEYYPVLGDDIPPLTTSDTLIDGTNISGILTRITELVQANEDNFTLSDRQGFLSDYCHMMGRYYIRSADYKQGMPYIDMLIKFNTPCSSEHCCHNLIKANRQRVCVYMNRYEPTHMGEVVQESFQLLDKSSKPEEVAVWLRLAGISNLMFGDLSTAEKHFSEAISLFEKSSQLRQYNYNLAASYAGLGEVNRCRSNYEQAIICYKHAISLCQDYFLDGGTATFYTYAGQAALDNHDLANAEEYLSHAVECFSKSELLWKRGIAFAYGSLLYFLQKDYKRSLQYLKIAERSSTLLGSRYELGVLNRICAWMAVQIKTSPEAAEVFSSYIDCSPQEYVNRAHDLLSTVFSPIDQIYLTEIERDL